MLPDPAESRGFLLLCFLNLVGTSSSFPLSAAGEDCQKALPRSGHNIDPARAKFDLLLLGERAISLDILNL